MDRQTAIREYLKKNHIGMENAIHSRELQRLFSLAGRTLRRKIHDLRQNGTPICSDRHGYYYADTQKEINETVTRLNTMVMKISNARTGLLYASLLNCTEGLQLKVSVELIPEKPYAE